MSQPDPEVTRENPSKHPSKMRLFGNLLSVLRVSRRPKEVSISRDRPIAASPEQPIPVSQAFEESTKQLREQMDQFGIRMTRLEEKLTVLCSRWESIDEWKEQLSEIRRESQQHRIDLQDHLRRQDEGATIQRLEVERIRSLLMWGLGLGSLFLLVLIAMEAFSLMRETGDQGGPPIEEFHRAASLPERISEAF